MNRVAFKMKLNPGKLNEYKKRHNEIWPELSKLLKDSGISDYSIFFDDESNYLFAVQKVDGTKGSQDLSSNPIVQKWWDYMADIMEVEENNAPVSIPLEEVFYLA